MFRHNLEKRARTFLRLVGECDVERVLDMCTPDVTYIDSLGVEVSGRQEVARVLTTVDQMGLAIEMFPEKFRRFRDELYISGHFTGSDPRFNARCEWRIRFNRRKVAEYQTSRPDEAPSLVNITKNYAERGSSLAH